MMPEWFIIMVFGFIGFFFGLVFISIVTTIFRRIFLKKKKERKIQWVAFPKEYIHRKR